MSEKIYALLLKLYPEHFRRTHGDEALRFVRDRARIEKGFLRSLRLWFDLLADLVMSLPREYNRSPTPVVTTQLLNSEASFQLLVEPPPNPATLFLGAILSAALIWTCVFAVGHIRTFPTRFATPASLQGLVQSSLAQAREPYPEEASSYSFCMTTSQDIPANSIQPLFAFHFAPPGASGVALMDGKIVETFRNEQRLSIRAHLLAGAHHFALHLEKPAENTFLSRNDAFQYCQQK